MSVVVYKCTECKREVHKPQNKQGLEIISRCTITNNCRGKLLQVDFKQDYVQGSLPSNVEGLENWVQRRILHTHEQTLSATQWKIKHNLGSEPSVQTFILIPSGNTEVLTEVTPQSITTVDANELIITFSQARKGTAQLIARSSVVQGVTATVSAEQTSLLTAQSIFTIATLDAAASIVLQAQTLSPTSFEPTALVSMTMKGYPDLSTSSPWKGIKKLLIKGKLFTVRSNFVALSDSSMFGNITDGSPFYFTGGVLPNTVFVLLTNSPYTEYDKDINNYIDITSVTSTNANEGFALQKNQLYAYSKIKEPAYPPIRIAQ